MIRPRLEVDVAGAIPGGARDHPLENRNGGLLGQFIATRDLERRRIEHDCFRRLLERLDEPLVAIIAIQRGQDLFFEREHRLHFAAGGEADVVERAEILGLASATISVVPIFWRGNAV